MILTAPYLLVGLLMALRYRLSPPRAPMSLASWLIIAAAWPLILAIELLMRLSEVRL